MLIQQGTRPAGNTSGSPSYVKLSGNLQRVWTPAEMGINAATINNGATLNSNWIDVSNYFNFGVLVVATKTFNMVFRLGIGGQRGDVMPKTQNTAWGTYSGTANTNVYSVGSVPCSEMQVQISNSDATPGTFSVYLIGVSF